MCSKIFCFDLDMTLLDHKTFHISEKVLKDLEALKKEGHVVAVATGRDMDSEFSKAYKKQLQPDAIVHSNGQKVTVGEKKIREVFRSAVSAGADLIRSGESGGLCPAVRCHAHSGLHPLSARPAGDGGQAGGIVDAGLPLRSGGAGSRAGHSALLGLPGHHRH